MRSAATWAELIRLCSAARSPDALLVDALPLVVTSADAAAGIVVRRRTDGLHLVTSMGAEAEPSSLSPELYDEAGPSSLAPVTTPTSWAAAGLDRAAAVRLPGGDAVLVLGWAADHDGEAEDLDLVVTLLCTGLARVIAEHDLEDVRQRVDFAQQLANMGDYDWHIATDTNTWSHQLFRIYGHEPQSFNPSYERFLSFIHPDDRTRIQAIHQEAYATGEPYQMIERVVRPNGEVRYLSSNGQVVQDETGTPVRMRGTCIDITDRVLAEQARERSIQRFSSLVESSPDAILVLDNDGTIVQANGRAESFLGGDPVGHPVSEIVEDPEDLHAGLGVKAVGLDGRTLQIDVQSAELGDDADEGAHVAVFVHDAAARLAGEAMAAGLREGHVRRRQAMEINDNVVQGLTAASMALEHGDASASASYMRRTLRAARQMMDDLLDPIDGVEFHAGDLIRSKASTLKPDLGADSSQPADLGTGPATRRRILVVDDSEDVRMLLRVTLQDHEGCDVIGEAGDGAEAVALAEQLQPDLVILDLAMPRMDGLQALPMIRERAPAAQVVVLSGFDEATMADQALGAGAARYVEKGTAIVDIIQVIDEVSATPA